MRKLIPIILCLFYNFFPISSCANNLLQPKASTNLCLQLMDKRFEMPGIIELGHCQLTNADMPIVANYLNAHPRVFFADLSNNAISADGAAVLSQVKIKFLDLSNNPIDDRAVTNLLQNKQLSGLFLGNTSVTDSSAIAIAGARQLSIMDLSNTRITSRGLAALASKHNLQDLTSENVAVTPQIITALTTNQGIISVSLKYAKLSSADIIALAKNPSFTDLDLEGNVLDTPAINALASNESLETLSLNNTGLTDANIIQLARSTTLKNLFVEHNHLTLNSAFTLAHHTSLQGLDISHNPIGDQGAVLLAQNPKIRSLLMRDANVSTAAAIKIGLSTKVRSLDLSHNPIGNAALGALLNDFHDRHGGNLDISYTDINDAGLATLKPASANVSNKILMLQGNKITVKGLRSLSAFYNQHDILNLDVSHNLLVGDSTLAMIDTHYPQRKISSYSIGGNSVSQPAILKLLNEPTISYINLIDIDKANLNSKLEKIAHLEHK